MSILTIHQIVFDPKCEVFESLKSLLYRFGSIIFYMFKNVNNQSASFVQRFLGPQNLSDPWSVFCGNSHPKMVQWNLGVHRLVWVNMLHSFISRVKVDYHLHPLTMPKWSSNRFLNQIHLLEGEIPKKNVVRWFLRFKKLKFVGLQNKVDLVGCCIRGIILASCSH